MIALRQYQQLRLRLKRIAYQLRHSIIRRLLVVVFSIYLFLTVIVTLAHMDFEYEFSKNQTLEALQNIQAMVHDSLSQAIWEFNGAQLDTILKGVYTNKYIVGIKLQMAQTAAIPGFSDKEWGLIEDDEGKMFYVNPTNKQRQPYDDTFMRLIPDQFDIYHVDALKREIIIGKMYLYSSNKIVFEQVKDSYILIIINAVIKTIALWIFFLWAGYYYVSKPLAQLSDAIKQIASGDWNAELIIKTPRRGHKTEINTLFETFNDMTTQLHTAQDKLAESRNRLTNIFDTMPSALISVDDKFIIRGWNKTMVEDTGIEINDAIGNDIAKVYPIFNAYLDLIKDAFRTQKVQQLKNAILGEHHDEDSRLYNITVYPVHSVTPAEAVIRIDDVTEQVKNEADLAQVEKLASVGASIAGVAHEINNPLGSIMQSTQNIVRRIDPNLESNQKLAQEINLDLKLQHEYLEKREILKFLDSIRDAGERASSIVKNMLKFTRRANVEMLEHDLIELINDGLQLAATDVSLQEHADFKQINIIKNFAVQSLMLQCNPMEIQQVILNIIKNAVQAIKPDQACKDITITVLEPQDNRVTLEISDNGAGMTEKVMEQIFQPFFTTKPVGIGTGLGLSVCKNIIVQKHHGIMEVKSTVDVGTTFTIVLPIKQPQ